MKSIILMTLGAAFCTCATVNAEVKPECSGIFTDHMVLQRGKDTAVWGRAEPGTEITAKLGEAKAEGTADAAGDWIVKFAELKTCAVPGELIVSIGEKKCSFNDVLVGDVWMVSGQSNAEMTFGFNGHVVNEKEELAKAKDFPNIRAVKMQRTASVWPIPYATCNTPWCVAEAKTLSKISAMGYFFARDINGRTGVPIGILDDNWSGQPIEMFLSERALESDSALEPNRRGRDQWRAHLAEWCEKAAAQFRGAKRPAENIGWMPEMPLESRIYNAMMLPIAKLRIAGVLWYQGCANAGMGLDYERMLESLIRDWRRDWGAELPFYVVQLANHHAPTADAAGGDGFARVREAQRRAVMKTPRTGLAVAIDIGNAVNIHPPNKQDVGCRLARWARRDVYGEKGVVVSGPLYRGAEFKDGRARIFFDHVGSGLCAADKDPDGAGIEPVVRETNALRGFSVRGKDGAWHFADAIIDDDTVVVSSKEVAEPVAVRYAYRGNPAGKSDLYNREGLPASPFTTE